MLQESEGDRQAEAEIIARLATYWDVDSEKISLSYGLDFTMLDGDQPDGSPTVVVFVEAKDRDWNFGDGDGYRVSLLKTMNAKLLAMTTGKRCLLAVRFRCGNIYWADFADRDGRVIMAGRPPRPGCPNDREPHVIVPWTVWHLLPPTETFG